MGVIVQHGGWRGFFQPGAQPGQIDPRAGADAGIHQIGQRQIGHQRVGAEPWLDQLQRVFMRDAGDMDDTGCGGEDFDGGAGLALQLRPRRAAIRRQHLNRDAAGQPLAPAEGRAVRDQ